MKGPQWPTRTPPTPQGWPSCQLTNVSKLQLLLQQCCPIGAQQFEWPSCKAAVAWSRHVASLCFDLIGLWPRLTTTENGEGCLAYWNEDQTHLYCNKSVYRVTDPVISLKWFWIALLHHVSSPPRKLSTQSDCTKSDSTLLYGWTDGQRWTLALVSTVFPMWCYPVSLLNSCNDLQGQNYWNKNEMRLTRGQIHWWTLRLNYCVDGEYATRLVTGSTTRTRSRLEKCWLQSLQSSCIMHHTTNFKEQKTESPCSSRTTDVNDEMTTCVRRYEDVVYSRRLGP